MSECPVCCEVCGRQLADWEGNVMVNGDYYRTHRIEEVRFICKECTRKMAHNRALHDAWHNLWELSWWKNPADVFDMLQRLMNDMVTIMDDPESAGVLCRWSKRALGRVVSLAAVSLGIELDEERHLRLWEVPLIAVEEEE